LELPDVLGSWTITEDGKPGWSVKGLHKAIMLSNAYQQSSRKSSHGTSKGNWMPETVCSGVRMSAVWIFEAFRDSLLAMSGSMDSTVFGPPVNLVSEPYSFRRSVYGYLDRANMPDISGPVRYGISLGAEH